MRPLIRVEEGDIAGFHGDAVVNAANNHLRMGAGVAGALLARGGPTIQADCDDIIRREGPLPVGGAAVTGSGTLPVRFVIHAAAMGDEPASEASIAASTRRALELAVEYGARTIAFPILGTGVGGFPFERSATVMVDVMLEHGAVHELPESVALYAYTPDQAVGLRRVLDGAV